MDPALHGLEENVNRVACLDTFLQSFSCRAAGDSFPQTPSNSVASPTATPVSGNKNASTSGATAAAGVSTLGEEGGIGKGIGTAAVQAEVLKGLDFLFWSDRSLVESAIQVLDKSRVVKVVARVTGRSVWLVQGSRRAPYLCLREYCSCRSFQELVRRGGEHPVLVGRPPTAA
eukprot:g17235.t3